MDENCSQTLADDLSKNKRWIPNNREKPGKCGRKKVGRQLPSDFLPSLMTSLMISTLYLTIAGISLISVFLAFLMFPGILLSMRQLITLRDLLSLMKSNQSMSSDRWSEMESLLSQQRVAVIWPTRNEPRDVLEHITLKSLLELQWSGFIDIVIADNSDPDHPDFAGWVEHIQQLKKQLPGNRRIHFLHRPDPDSNTPEHLQQRLKGYKGGNLDMAINFCKQQLAPDYYLLVDTDSTLCKEALIQSIPEFIKDPRTGFVQLSTLPQNVDCNLFTRAASWLIAGQRLSLGMRGKDSFLCFYGHNGIFSAQAIDAVGSWVGYLEFKQPSNILSGEKTANLTCKQVILTEDFSAALGLYAQELKGKPVSITAGEWVPFSLKDWRTMWLRWVFGTLQILLKNMKWIFSPKLRIQDRYGIFLHIAEYFNKPLILTLVSLVLVTDSLPLIQASHVSFCFYIFVFVVFNLSLLRIKAIDEQLRFRGVTQKLKSFLLLLSLEFLTILFVTEAIILFIRKKSQGWTTPTAKGIEKKVVRWWVNLKNFYVIYTFLILIGILFILRPDLTLHEIVNRLPVSLITLFTILGLIVFSSCGRYYRQFCCAVCGLNNHCPAVQ